MSKKSNSVLSELKSLVNNLSDRDVKIKTDFRLFEDFFEHFPVPVSMWSASICGSITSIKDKGFFCKDAKDVEGLFECTEISKSVHTDHLEACEGRNTQRFVEKNDKMFFVSVVSRKDEKGNVVGASGIAWDVTSNMTILNILKEVKERLEINSITSEEIIEKVSVGISKSRLNKIISGGK